MRRKLWTVAAVLLFLIVLCVFEQAAVRRITNEALDMTQGLLADIRQGAFDSAKQKAHALDGAWDKQAKLLEMMVDHSATDDVRYALSKLLAALEGKDKASALIYAGELEGSVEHVYERQALTLENLL